MTEPSNVAERPRYRLPAFAEHIGIQMVSADPQRVVGRIVLGPQHSNGRDRVHGGAIMALADTLGAIGTVLNLPKGSTTAPNCVVSASWNRAAALDRARHA